MPTPTPTPADDVPVVSDTQAAPPAEPEKAKFVAKGPIFINGVRAYNEGDAVSENAVKNNKLQDFVTKA